MRCSSRIQTAVLIALLIAPMFVGAQIPGLPKKAAEPVVENPIQATSISIADIPEFIERDEQLLQAVMQRSVSDSGLLEREKELLAIRSNVDSFSSKVSPQQLKKLPISGLVAFERHLQFLDRELKNWQADLQRIARPLSEDSAELAYKRELWLATQSLSGSSLVPAMRTSIDNLLVDFKRAEQSLSEPLSTILKLSLSAAKVQSRIDLSRSNVADRIAAINRGLWQVDSDNLFRAYADQSKTPPNSKNILANGLQAELAFIKEYDRESGNRVATFLFIALLAMPIFFWLSNQANSILAKGSKLDQYRKTLTRPFSAWLLLTIMMLLLLQLSGPSLRLKLLLIIAWVPVMRLQPKHLLDSVGNWMYLTAVFFLINLFAQAVSSIPFLFRMVILVNDVLMLATLCWLLYSSAQRLKVNRVRMDVLLRSLAAIGILLMLVAITANIIGNVTLAAMLTDATLNSAYLGLFLFAVGTVIRAFTRFLFRNSVDKLNSNTQNVGGLLQVLSQLFNLALVSVWFYGTIKTFRIFQPLVDSVKFVMALGVSFGTISITLGGVVMFWILVYLSFWLSKTIRSVLSEDILPNMELPRGVANSVSSLSYYALLLFGLMVALSAAGFQISQLAIILGALSVGIGLGLQSVVNNFVSGLILMVERPVQPGDIVEVSGTTGKVREIGMRATTLTTFEGADVIVPNGMLLSEKMINWTLSSDKRRIDIPLGVSYNSDPSHVLKILNEVAVQSKGVSKNPAPSVVFVGFGPNSLDFSIRAWTDSYDDSIFIRSDMAINIHTALREAGIDIPLQQRNLHVKSSNAEYIDKIQRGES